MHALVVLLFHSSDQNFRGAVSPQIGLPAMFFGIWAPAITYAAQPLYLYHKTVWPLLILELLMGEGELGVVGGDPDP